jgi:ketosteroid isomerase-like protein
MLRRTIRALSLVTVMTLPALRDAHSQAAMGPLPPDLRRAIEVFDRAQVSADTATLARLVTEDYVLVNSDATIDRKAKYLSDFLLPGLRMEPYLIEQRVEKAWGDAAVVFGLQRLAWTQDGTRHQRDLRIVHVWTKQSGRWKVTHTQLTRIPE